MADPENFIWVSLTTEHLHIRKGILMICDGKLLVLFFIHKVCLYHGSQCALPSGTEAYKADAEFWFSCESEAAVEGYMRTVKLICVLISD